MEEGIINNLDEIDTIIAELEISKGKGNLILCVVNSPAYRDRILQTLRGRFTSKVIHVENGEQIIRNLKSRDFDAVDVLIWVMPEEPTEDLLNTLNNFRELFYEVKIPNLMFYNQAFSESVLRKAPDFWRYRGNYYELEEAERGMAFEAIETLATPLSYQDKEDLLRRKRIDEYLLKTIRDKEEKVKILTELGTVFYYSGELDKALEYYGKALKLDEKLGRKEGIGAMLHQIGIIHQDKGEYEEALEKYNESLKIKEELGNKSGIAATLHQIGIIHYFKGEYEEALERYNESLKIEEELGNKSDIAATLHQIGIIHQDKGEYEEALEKYNESLKIKEELGNKSGIATTLHQIGIIHQDKGEYEEALEKYNKSLKIKEELGNKSDIAATLHQIGIIHQDKGEYEEALEKYNESLKIEEELGDKRGIALTLGQIGRIKHRQNKYHKAILAFATAASFFKELESPYFQTAIKDLASIKEEIGEDKFNEIIQELEKDTVLLKKLE